MTFTPDQITFFRTFLQEQSGYHLVPGKEYLLESRLKLVISAHKLNSFQDIIEAIKRAPHGDIAVDTIEAMTVNETFFFRDDAPFKHFTDKIIPILAEWGKTRPIKIWSAACSTGQEPYSIAIGLEESKVKYPHLKYEIMASDINNRILTKARHGVYSNMEVARGVPDNYKRKYFTQTHDTWRISDTIRNSVTFFHHNLKANPQMFRGPYDLVFLRNVLIYFDMDLKKDVLRRVAETMRTDAYMVLGVAENIYDPSLPLKREDEMTGVYKKIAV